MGILRSALAWLCLLLTTIALWEVEALGICQFLSSSSVHNPYIASNDIVKPFSGISIRSRSRLFATTESGETSSSSSSSSATNGETEVYLNGINNNNNNYNNNNDNNNHRSFRRRVKRLTKKIVPWSQSSSSQEQQEHSKQSSLQIQVDEAFCAAEESIRELEESLVVAKAALANAKMETYKAIALQQPSELRAWVPPPNGLQEDETKAMAASPNGSSSDTNPNNTNDNSNDKYNLDALTFEDIDYESSEMAPPFLDQDSCLMPDAEPLVRVEKAPDNSRRIFAGIDILASADDVWNVLTDYHELQNVIPNLVVNDVLDIYEGDPSAAEDAGAEDLPEEVRCANLSRTMKGSLLRQVGGAKVAGINFSAKTTLEVREWPNGMPDFAHFMDDMWEGKSREERAKEYPRTKLKRYRFPRPFALSNLPTRDISMQSIANDDGEFRMYQGVWRMQPLVGCSPPGKNAMRLTYAVEISPRVYLPVKLIEGRIVRDLCSNLEAIREAVSAGVE